MHSSIRPAAEQDTEQIQAIYAPYVRDTCISFEAEPPSVQEMAHRLVKITERWPWLVYERNGQILGYAYASEHRTRSAYLWSVDVAVYVHNQFHRAGIGRALYSTLFPLLKLQGFFNAYAGVALPNPGSVGLHEAMGFKPVGIYQGVGYKFGFWHDVGWWHLALQEKQSQPVPPLSLRAIQQHPTWKSAFDKRSRLQPDSIELG